MTSAAQEFTPCRGTLEHGRSWIGRRQCLNAGDEGGALVTESMVKTFAAVLDDDNPRYWDDGRCPPALLFSLGLQPRRSGAGQAARTYVLGVPLPGEYGIAVESSAEFYRPIRVGDRLTVTEEVVAISDDKRTGLGIGNFLTVAAEYVGHDHELRARHVMTSLRYDPYDSGGQVDRKTNGVRSSEVGDGRSVGELPQISMAITYLRVIQGAAATFDWFPGHHDPAFARSQGIPNIYLNTMVCQGIVDRLVLNWGGADAVLQKRSVRIRRPVIAGDTATASGSIASIRRDGPDEVIDIDAAIDTADGTCVTARATIARMRS